MSLHRFFAEGPLAPSGVLPLSETDRHHLRDVVRLEPGEEIVVVFAGVASRVRLTEVAGEVAGEVVGSEPSPGLPRVTLVQGLAKGEKMDAVVRQTTELGVARIVPLQADRSVVRLHGAKAVERTERWRRIAAEAAKQSQRADIPVIAPLARLEDLGGVLAGTRVLICQEEDHDAPGIADALAPGVAPTDSGVTVIVGPEGGLTPFEVAALERQGGTRVTLGPTVLRTETAAVVAVALALNAGGGIGSARG